MTVFDLLSRLRRDGVTLWVEEDKLRYSAAKGSLTLALREQIAERKAEIIDSLRQLARTEASAAPPIKNISRDQPLPLSFAQQRLWFLDQLVPGNTFYNMSLSMPLHFPINVRTLERSLNELVRRHESLRTTFVMQDGGPVQIITPDLMIPLTVEDLTGLLPAQRETEAQRLSDEEARRAFDLACGPLLRTTLLKLDVVDFRLLLSMHHIVSDGWSMGIFLKELSAIYPAFSMGRTTPLPPLRIQYPDFAVWQREWLQGEVLQRQLAYWKQQLADLPMLLLPTDRPRPNIQTFQGGYHPVRLPLRLADRLKALSQQEGVTLFMTLLAAFQAMLQRYTGQEDIVVGAPIAGRNHSEIENLIGFFVNSLVLRTDLSGNPTVRELLGRVREVTLGAYGHQDLPFEMLVEELQPERDLSRNPLFQVTFQLLNAPTVEQTVESSELAREVRRGTTIFDIVFILTETPHGLVGGLEYDSDLFDAGTIERMATHFETLLEGMVANPDQRLSELPLLTNAEQTQILREWNDTADDFPRDVCLHQLIEAQVQRSPDAIAVVSGSEQITYQELNRRANQLAYYLKTFDVGPDTLIGICATQSIEMVAGLLAVLKAGGAYVPLDPAYPAERLRFMIEDAKVGVLLTQTAIAEYLPKNGRRVVYLDQEVEQFAGHLIDNPESVVSPQNLAYMLYTSGSTGRPRGVMVSHGAICNHMLWMQQAFPLNALDRVIQRTAFSFDASVWEFYAPLLAGAQLIMYQPRPHLDIPDLIKTIVTYQITTLQLVPSLLRMLLDDPAFYTCSTLRRVFCGGEALSIELQKRFFNRSDAELCNLYGPTEACIDATFMQCQRDGNRQVVPIGRPIANAQAYVLDAEMRPVPAGVAGELYLGGRGLARGYFNRPEFTADKFIPNPFSDEKGSRLYRTGDLLRYRADGNLEFLGRIDHQVKVRGYRIELGEIENVLAQHSRVKEAVVLAREDVPGDRRLTAYVVQNLDVPAAEDSGTELTGELRRALQQQLPEYMVPSVFVLLDAFPLTPNGKINRTALPAPGSDRPELKEEYVEPSTSTEKLLADIWKQVLGLERIGIHDNFFALGGDSILSIQIMARANQAGVQLTPQQFFQHQTIAELAIAGSTAAQVEAEQQAVTGPVPLTPIQHWFLEQELTDLHHFNQSVLLDLGPSVDPKVVAKCVQHLLLQHDALRLKYEQSVTGWSQYSAPPDEGTPFTTVDLSSLRESEQTAALEAKAAELKACLNLTEGPILSAALFELGGGRSQLLVVIHALVVDRISWHILVEDLLTTYKQLSRGETVKLQDKTTCFKHWAHRLTEYAQTEAVKKESHYWLAQQKVPAPRLPVDYTGDNNTGDSARMVITSIGEEETLSLLQDVSAAYHTQVEDSLLSALVQALGQWAGTPAILFDLKGHSRERLFDDVDLTRTVGCFTSIFPVQLELEGIDDPGKALKSVKEQLRRIPKGGIDYGILRYLTDDDEITTALSHLPQAEISFNYSGQFGTPGADLPVIDLSQETVSQFHDLRKTRRHLLEINFLVKNGRLQMIWTYSENFHRRSTVEALAETYTEKLSTLIAHCKSPEAGGYTPSDFSKARLSQTDLDKLLSKINRSSQRRLDPDANAAR